MIADAKIFTVKKSVKPQIVAGVIGIGALGLAGYLNFQSLPPSVTFHIAFAQAGMLAGLGLALWANGKILRLKKQYQIAMEGKQQEISGLQNICAAKSRFIGTVGEEMLDTSREMYDAAGYLYTSSGPEEQSMGENSVEKRLYKNADRMYDLSQDVVTLARLEKGKIGLREQEIDTTELINFCVASVNRKHREKEPVVVVQVTGRPNLVRGDLARLKQLLGKMLTCATGLIEIEGAKVHVSLRFEKRQGVVFSVKLNGRQLSADEFEKLCDPMGQGGDHRGAGCMDMAIARGLARLHGGDIVVDKQTSSGTVVALKLPGERVSQIPLHVQGVVE